MSKENKQGDTTHGSTSWSSPRTNRKEDYTENNFYSVSKMNIIQNIKNRQFFHFNEILVTYGVKRSLWLQIFALEFVGLEESVYGCVIITKI